MKNTRLFISPPVEAEGSNQYIPCFFEYLDKKGIIVNQGKKKHSRATDMVAYGLKSEVMILHWSEDIAILKFGIFQALLSVAVVLFFKLKGGKVVWFCHNKRSHFQKNRWLNKLLRNFYITVSNKIIVHSTDALSYLPSKAVYLPHPAYQEQVQKKQTTVPAYDVLIWGNIFRYKGLHKFVDAYKRLQQNISILIIGKAEEGYYEELIVRSAGTNISIEDKFLDDELLQSYFDQCKFILLPYLDSDTFCSGALIHSLNSNKIIFGPSLGNFVDVRNEGACLVYEDYEDLFNQLNRLLNNPLLYGEQLYILQEGMSRYKQKNSWEGFMNKFLNVINDKPRSNHYKPAVFRKVKRMFGKKPFRNKRKAA